MCSICMACRISPGAAMTSILLRFSGREDEDNLRPASTELLSQTTVEAFSGVFSAAHVVYKDRRAWIGGWQRGTQCTHGKSRHVGHDSC